MHHLAGRSHNYGIWSTQKRKANKSIYLYDISSFEKPPRKCVIVHNLIEEKMIGGFGEIEHGREKLHSENESSRTVNFMLVPIA